MVGSTDISFSGLATSYAACQDARASWFVPASNTVDALAKLGIIGPADRLVAFADDFEGPIRAGFGASAAFVAEPSVEAFLAASARGGQQGAEAPIADDDAPDDVTPEHPVHHASYAHAAGACFEHLFWFVNAIGGRCLRVPDIRALARAAQSVGAILVVDDTVPSSFGCTPLQMGAHLCLEALDRVAAGGLAHKLVGISVARSVTGRGRKRRTDPLAEAAYVLLAMRLGEQVAPASSVAPADLAAVADGLSTLSVRMQAHMDHARAIAEYLACHPAVAGVHYPGLSSHPDHGVAASVLRHGYGPAVDFEVPEPARARHLISVLDPSFRRSPAGGRATRLSAPFGDDSHYLRLFAGVDDPLDIVDSLDQALRMFCNPPQP